MAAFFKPRATSVPASPAAEDFRVIALAKGDQRFILLFTEATRADALRQLGEWAANPDLVFSWSDAAILSREIRKNAI